MIPIPFHDLDHGLDHDLLLDKMDEKCPAVACSYSLSFSQAALFLLMDLAEKCLALDMMAEKCQTLACSCSQVAALALSSEEQLAVT